MNTWGKALEAQAEIARENVKAEALKQDLREDAEKKAQSLNILRERYTNALNDDAGKGWKEILKDMNVIRAQAGFSELKMTDAEIQDLVEKKLGSNTVAAAKIEAKWRKATSGSGLPFITEEERAKYKGLAQELSKAVPGLAATDQQKLDLDIKRKESLSEQFKKAGLEGRAEIGKELLGSIQEVAQQKKAQAMQGGNYFSGAAMAGSDEERTALLAASQEATNIQQAQMEELKKIQQDAIYELQVIAKGIQEVAGKLPEVDAVLTLSQGLQ
jgi:hypothetical protein